LVVMKGKKLVLNIVMARAAYRGGTFYPQGTRYFVGLR